jgi:signal transduction histidine kinase/ActR/RegA family two-component response regulator
MNGLERWITHSLRRRIAVLVSVLLLIVGAGIALVSYLEVLRVTRELREDRLHQLGGQLAPLLARGPADLLVRLTRTSADSAVVRFVASSGTAGRASASAALHGPPGSQGSGVALLDTLGRILLQEVADTSREGFGPAVAPEDGELLAQGGVSPYRRLGDSTLYYDAFAPIRWGGARIGTLVRRSRMQLSRLSRSTYGVVVGTGTEILLGSPATGIWTDLASIIPAPPPEAIGTDTVRRFAWQGKEVLGLAVPIEHTPWLLAVRTDYGVIEAPARGYLRRAALIAALFVGLGGIAAVVVGRRIGRPIEEITEVTEQIASGDDARRANEALPGEVGRLGRAFNAMVERVASSTRRLRDSEASHRAFVTHASEGIWHVEFVPPISTSLSRDLQITSWYQLAPQAECNAALARMHGEEADAELTTIPLERLFPSKNPASRKLLTSFIERGYRCSEVESILEHDGDPRQVFVNDLIGIIEQGGLRRIWGTRRDVTLERLMDDRLAQTQRLEAIGRLAGGIAHDFNNLLTAILGYAESLQERLAVGVPGREDAVEIDRLALRASELTRHLLAFSRGQVLRPAALDLNVVVRSTETLLRRVIGEDIELKLQLADSLPAVEADAGQLERVLMNLALNARDAMPSGGTLELRTTTTELDAEYTRARPGLVPGSYVMLAVGDTGSGMTEEVRRHIFEPFFTTKPKGSGTGLGLSTVYGIVRQSGGEISVYTEVGKGTTFKIFLPVRGRLAGEAPAASASRSAADPTGHETILLVEDEAPVREIVRRALAAAGYSVLVARDGQEALRIGADRIAEIDLVLTDMILPGMTGRDLVADFRGRRPGIRVMIMSGYTGETYPALESLPGDIGYLEKPFSLADLRRKVREALDGGERNA